MAKLTAQELIDAIKEMTVLELNDLVKAYPLQRALWLRQPALRKRLRRRPSST